MTHGTHPPPAPAAADGSRLVPIRKRLAAVRRSRRRRRFAAGWATLVVVLAAVAVAVFACDWLLVLPPTARLALLAAAAGAAAWACRRHVLPWFSAPESDLDLALAVEKEQGLEGDLVAALQFDSPAAAAWGSRTLRGAVVDYVAAFGRDWTIPGRTAGPVPLGRLITAAAFVAGIATGCILRPDFARAFLERMALGRTHYPTRTVIRELSIGGRTVPVAARERSVVTCPVGQPVDFVAALGGVLPASGRLRITAAASREDNWLDMTAEAGGDPGTFVARLQRLFEPIEVQVFAGDAWTDPVSVGVVPLPAVEMRLSAVAPGYAAQEATRRPAASNARQITAFAGSRIGVDVSCTNKRLRSATLVIDAAEHPLAPSASGREWSLPPQASPLSCLTEPVTFDLRVVDEDGMSPERPIACSVRILRDAPPRVSFTLATRVALPTAAPTLTWQVDDDHGVRDVSLVMEAVAEEGESRPEPRMLSLAEMPEAGWVPPAAMPLRGSIAIPLASFGLAKGQRLRVAVRAVDYRGDLEGQATVSDAAEIEITDEPGVLASIAEDDRRAMDRLDAIVDKQLHVGGPETPLPSPGAAP